MRGRYLRASSGLRTSLIAAVTLNTNTFISINMTKSNIVKCRPREYITKYARKYPDAWRKVDVLRAARGFDLPQWPDWCFLPLAGAAAIVSGGWGKIPSLNSPNDLATLGALATWRVTQGIYRFDPMVYNSVRDTPLDREIPCEILYRLPEWCVYIETPGLGSEDWSIHGAFGHLEFDIDTKRPELRLVFDSDTGPLPIPLHLGPWSLAEAMDRTVAESKRQMGLLGLHDLSDLRDPLLNVEFRAFILPFVRQVVSLLLYLCSQAAEIGDGKTEPRKPQPKRVRGLPRLFPAEKPTMWDVGVRMGAALRRAYSAESARSAGHGGAHSGPKPHIRVAHWHGFWSGPRDDGPRKGTAERRFDVRWLPPISVNVDDLESLPAVARSVK